MKIFKCCKDGVAAIAVAFNRGHAVKLLSKEFEQRGLALSKQDAVIEVNTETKGEVHILCDGRSNQNSEETT
jgi:hypothetical protein